MKNNLALLGLVGIFACGFIRNRWLTLLAVVYLVAILVLLAMPDA
jgi:hypothetical protein